MGDVFSLGFGPFRWVCCSGLPEDLATTDQIAAEVFEELMKTANEKSREQYQDNLTWIKEAGKNKMVVGSQARILYSNCEGRVRLAVEFNKAVQDGRLTMPVVLSRDHHDVSGTDSPYRETSNIDDGSIFCADMAIQNVLGDAARGATWVSIHNGGGCGWGEVINGGFGMVSNSALRKRAPPRPSANPTEPAPTRASASRGAGAEGLTGGGGGGGGGGAAGRCGCCWSKRF
jgi:urocanate hydratase